jgi:hypothetical protein
MKPPALPLLALTGLLLAAIPAGADAGPGPSIYGVLPEDAAVGLRLEAALVTPDLRLLLRAGDHFRSNLVQTRLGAAFYDPAAQKQAFGFDFLAELRRIVDLAQPAGGAVPAAVAGYSSAQGPGVQLLLSVAPGFLDRLASARNGSDPPPYPIQVTDGLLQLPVGENQLVGRVGQDGWLRLAPEEGMLLTGSGVEPFTGSMRTWTSDCDVILFVRGGGVLADSIAGSAGDPMVGELLRSMRSIALGWRFDGESTQVTRLLLDAPQLEPLRATLRQPQLVNSLAQVWDDQTTAFLSLSLPPPIIAMVAPLVEQGLAGSELPSPEPLLTALAKLDGQVGAVFFDAPGDWAVGLGFKDAQTAQSVAPALQPWLVAAMAKLETDVSKSYVLETLPPGGEQVMHLRSDVGIEGMRLAPVGNDVVLVRQKSRLQGLLARQRLPVGPDRPPVAGPLTTTMRQALETPAMILGYTQLGVDGSITEWLAWMASGAAQAWRTAKPPLPGAEAIGKLLERMPTLLTLAGVTLSLTYDAALWVDVDNSVLVIQLLTSEI